MTLMVNVYVQRIRLEDDIEKKPLAADFNSEAGGLLLKQGEAAAGKHLTEVQTAVNYQGVLEEEQKQKLMQHIHIQRFFIKGAEHVFKS